MIRTVRDAAKRLPLFLLALMTALLAFAPSASAAWGDEVVRENIEVSFHPEEHRVATRVTLTLPASLLPEFFFLLHSGLNPSAETAGAVLEPMNAAPKAGAGRVLGLAAVLVLLVGTAYGVRQWALPVWREARAAAEDAGAATLPRDAEAAAEGVWEISRSFATVWRGRSWPSPETR